MPSFDALVKIINLGSDRMRSVALIGFCDTSLVITNISLSVLHSGLSDFISHNRVFFPNDPFIGVNNLFVHSTAIIACLIFLYDFSRSLVLMQPFLKCMVMR